MVLEPIPVPRPVPGPDEDPAIMVHPTEPAAPPEQLVGKMDDLTGLLRELKLLKVDQKKTWWWLKGGAGFLIFDVIVSIAGAIAIFFGSQVIDRVDRQQHNVCTLYGFVINSYNQTSREKSPLGPAQYDSFFHQLQTAADGTQCNIPHKI